MPVGSFYVAVAGVLLAIVLAYVYGVSVGRQDRELRRAQQHQDEMNAAAQLPAVDPLQAGKRPPNLPESGDGLGKPAAGAAGAAGATGATGDGGRKVAPPSSGVERAGGAEDLGPAPGGDPRQDGLNYFVVAHTANRNGEAMVDFCRKNGLDAHLVPDDNGELRLVIVAPGFASGERQSAVVKTLEAKIRSVGLKWKNAARGNRDFGDAYPKKFVADGSASKQSRQP